MIGWVRFTWPPPPQPPQPPKVTTDLKSFLQKCLVYNNKQNQILPATIKKKLL